MTKTKPMLNIPKKLLNLGVVQYGWLVHYKFYDTAENAGKETEDRKTTSTIAIVIKAKKHSVLVFNPFTNKREKVYNSYIFGFEKGVDS